MNIQDYENLKADAATMNHRELSRAIVRNFQRPPLSEPHMELTAEHVNELRAELMAYCDIYIADLQH